MRRSSVRCCRWRSRKTAPGVPRASWFVGAAALFVARHGRCEPRQLLRPQSCLRRPRKTPAAKSSGRSSMPKRPTANGPKSKAPAPKHAIGWRTSIRSLPHRTLWARLMGDLYQDMPVEKRGQTSHPPPPARLDLHRFDRLAVRARHYVLLTMPADEFRQKARPAGPSQGVTMPDYSGGSAPDTSAGVIPPGEGGSRGAPRPCEATCSPFAAARPVPRDSTC